MTETRTDYQAKVPKSLFKTVVSFHYLCPAGIDHFIPAKTQTHRIEAADATDAASQAARIARNALRITDNRHDLDG